MFLWFDRLSNKDILENFLAMISFAATFVIFVGLIARITKLDSTGNASHCTIPPRAKIMPALGWPGLHSPVPLGSGEWCTS